ncbi:hypothetical protein [Frankia sp. AgB32]|uniref:hypothetical protein n=1 Tax=Frankia sp. AgB32 TaxID=631119 RepID=UPI00200E6D80|nr:hypothetical protein [Frankia sp. AgB32]
MTAPNVIGMSQHADALRANPRMGRPLVGLARLSDRADVIAANTAAAPPRPDQTRRVR